MTVSKILLYERVLDIPMTAVEKKVVYEISSRKVATHHMFDARLELLRATAQPVYRAHMLTLPKE